ncbi:MAG: MFS transporter [Streptosporangiaceae bacterium]|nr:MFS transporter [Streptosporangiaceae bacterium]MBV9856976.1 MFS transporter [Streptosporangiaceae bacterium]
MSETTGGAGGAPDRDQPNGSAQAATLMLERRQILIVLPGLLLAILLAMLDQLIVGTALPRIVGSLGGVTHLSWVVTAYILASTVTTPFYGKLGDMYGRKRLFVAAIVIFLAGSALSGLSQSMAQLIAFRAVQGLGAGGLMVGAMATLGDIVPPRERGRYMSYMMVVMMLATIGGPLLGGFITDHFSWRWIFYINVPVGGAALVYLIATLHLPTRRVSHRIDYLGGVLLAVATTAIILLATWGGTQYRWGSPEIIGLGVISVAAAAAFAVTQMRAAEPILPLHVFRNGNFSLSMVLTFLTGLAMFGAMTFLPLYQQTVQRASATVSGLLLTPMMLGVTVTSIVAGQVTTKTGRYKIFPILGGAFMAAGMYLLTRLGADTTRVTSGLYYVVLGLGMGFLMQMVSLIAQNSVQLKDMGVASSARMFFQQIGGSLGVAAFGAVFASRLTGSLHSAARPGVRISAGGGQFDPATVNRLPGPLRHDVFVAIAHAIQGVFIWAVPASVLMFVLAWFIREVPLRGRAPAQEQGAPTTELVS